MRSTAIKESVIDIGRGLGSIIGALLFGFMFSSSAHALTLNVVDNFGAAVSDYRWVIEENGTKDSIPGKVADATNLSLSFHTSYMQVIASGDSSAVGLAKLTALALNPLKRYYVSVMPGKNNLTAAGGPAYQIGGAQVAAGKTAVTVKMIKGDVPTGQISVFIFEDNQPINGAPDLPQEEGLAGFNLILYEAGGTYGASGGLVSKNAFGHPIGTEYKYTIDPLTQKKIFQFGLDGLPVVATLGNGFVTSGQDGVARFKYLVPAKYTVFAVAPGGNNPTLKDQVWHQTSTIEGTKGIDAWPKPDEPTFFQEFGPPGHHVFIGFVKNINDATALTGTQAISGRVVNMHTARPPEYTFYNGDPIKSCRVGLNRVPGDRKAIYTTPCKADGTFSIPNVPAGTYQLAIWDDPLDLVIGLTTVTVPNNGANVNLLDVPVFSWFHRHTSRVFNDTNENGFMDQGEAPIPGQVINIRFRDGSIYASSVTDTKGEVKFKETFPFFNWMIAEVDYARYKATGATVVVDNGGGIPKDNGWTMPSFDVLNPQPQSLAVGAPFAGAPYRTETGPVLLEGFQGFLGTTNVIDWGKKAYAPGENGGIAGIVHYAITRAEADPRYAVAENWEPGVPRVQVNLYRDCNGDGIIDQGMVTLNAAGDEVVGAGCTALGTSAADRTHLADVDNYPFGWQNGTAPKGPEDVVNSGDGTTFSKGWAVVVTHTDSWDDSQPTGCQGDIYTFAPSNTVTDCYDGLRNFNQVRPAVFDGGYAFGTVARKPTLPAGRFVVEANTPPGYELVKEEDKNVDFGADHSPSALALPAQCVGEPHLVQAELSLFPGTPSTFAGQTRPLCDRKVVRVADGLNAAADFFLFTETPIAGHIVGMILDDTSNEFDPNAPTFGERHAPAWVPVSLRDWTGAEIDRVYADQYGTYNALVPSTFTINPAYPSGVAPNMITACMNHAGPIIDQRPGSPTLGESILDPNFQRQYSQFCYTFQYLPGKTTYLDTPVVPVAAFAGPGQFPLDCEYDFGTPVLYSVNGTAGGVIQNGPYVPMNNGQVRSLTIISAGTVDVSNPAYDGTATSSPTMKRDFGFGATAGSVRLNGVLLPVLSWNNDMAVVSVPAGASTGQLEVTRGDNGKATVSGVTVTVGTLNSRAPIIVGPGGSIQAAVNSAQAGDLILVAPGTYDERVIINKKVRVQGWGAPSTIINIANAPAEKLQAWRTLVNQMYAASTFDLVAGQTTIFNAPNNEPNLFGTEEGPGFLVVAKATGPNAFDNSLNARIDGFTISGADSGGGIFVNGYANYLEISNNKIVNNSGTYGGGIRFGHPELVNTEADAATDVRGGYTDNSNDFVKVHHNHITQNGGIIGASVGGGISISAGTDSYTISKNYICGNFSMGGGGGIGQVGHSANGLIDGNKIIFNQSFYQGNDVHGGGILVLGQATLTPNAAAPSAGTGSIAIVDNLIQGNQAGAGDGGGISLMHVNGTDVATAPRDPAAWYRVTIQNNKIVDNIAGLAGGGVSLLDVVAAGISNNTITNNDSTATTARAFAPNSPNASTPQPAGLVARAHSATLIATGAAVGTYSNPTLDNNILWHNRTFGWTIDNTVKPAVFGLVPNVAAPVYADLAVIGTANQGVAPLYTTTAGGAVADKLSPTNSTLTNTTGYAASNNSTDPAFVAQYFNGSPGQTILVLEGITKLGDTPVFANILTPTPLGTAPAFDEGGNFIDVRFGPLTLNVPCATGTCGLYGDYRLPNAALLPTVNFGGGGLPPAVAIQTPVAPAPADAYTPQKTSVFVQCPGDVNGVAIPGAAYPNVTCLHLSAGDGFISMADGKRLYTFGYSNLTGTLPSEAINKGILAANFPAPTIELKQGNEFFLTLTNVGMTMRPDLFDAHTVHFHGFPQQIPAFDGMPGGSFGVNMGASLTYYYKLNNPGTYMYHCHMEATEHMQMGMLGNLYVTPKQDGTLLNGYTKFVYNDGDGSTGYNKGYPLQLGGMDGNFHDQHIAIQPLPFAFMKDTYAMINGRGYPDTVVAAALPGPILDDGTVGVQSQPVSSLITLNRATEGNTLLLRMSNLNVTNFHTVTVLGLPMRVVGGGAAIARGPSADPANPLIKGKDMYYGTSSVTLGGGEATEIIINATGVPAGTYFLYTTNLNYLSNNDQDYGGMMTEIVIQ